MMVKNLDWHFIREPLGTRGLKEGERERLESKHR
jgi:hypothetical protein